MTVILSRFSFGNRWYDTSRTIHKKQPLQAVQEHDTHLVPAQSCPCARREVLDFDGGREGVQAAEVVFCKATQFLQHI